MELSIYEILDKFKESSTRKSKVELLRRFGTSKTLRDVLYLTFSTHIQFYRTDAPPKYRPDTDSRPGMGWSNLGVELRKMYLFIKDHPSSRHLTNEKRDDLLRQLLESLEPREAEVVIGILRKNLPAVDLTAEIVLEAFGAVL